MTLKARSSLKSEWNILLCLDDVVDIHFENRFTCGHMVDEQPFMEFEGGTPQSESDRWARFIGLSLRKYLSTPVGIVTDLSLTPAPNPQRRDVRLKYDVNGHPLLPQWNDDWNKTQAADVFKAFLNATWSMLGLSSATDSI